MKSLAGSRNANDSAQDKPAGPLGRQPLVVWALVLAAAMMSFYVHLLSEQVQRGERLRQAQRAVPAPHHAMRDLTPLDVSLAAAR